MDVLEQYGKGVFSELNYSAWSMETPKLSGQNKN